MVAVLHILAVGFENLRVCTGLGKNLAQEGEIKAKREAKKKREKKAANATTSRRTGAPFVAHAQLLDDSGALVAAGVLNLADALQLVRFRAQAMQQAVPVGTGAMAAVLA